MKVETNIGTLDRIIRLFVVIFLIILFYTGRLQEIWAVTSLIYALLLSGTTLVSYSPLYRILNINTTLFQKRRKKKS